MFACIVDSDEDEWRNFAGLNQFGGCFVGAPFLWVEDRGAGVEEVLSVVEIEDGITFAAMFGAFVAGRKPDPEHSGVVEDFAGEGAYFQVSNDGAWGFVGLCRRRLRFDAEGREEGRDCAGSEPDFHSAPDWWTLPILPQARVMRGSRKLFHVEQFLANGRDLARFVGGGLFCWG